MPQIINAILAIAIFINLPFDGVSQERKFITFYGTAEGLVGHAFISYVREDNNLQQTVVDGVWGMYPASRKDLAKNFIVGEVPGEIRDDLLTKRDIGLTVEVNQQEYLMALQIKERWNNATYQLTETDCLSFVIEVANSLSHKLVLPERSMFKNFPYTYIETLKSLNPNGTNNSSLSFCPHQDIVYDIPTDITIQINQGDYYWIDLNLFEINRTKYQYGEYKDIVGDKKIYKNFNAGVVLLETGGSVLPLQSKYGRFTGNSGKYRIIFNVDVSHPSVNVSATLTLVNQITHQNRNRYNKVAKGVLVRKNESSGVFLDEDGLAWELVSIMGNWYHDPCNTVKLLHKLPGGGEYETIRILEENEKNITGCGIGIGIQKLAGCNLLENPHGSSYNFGHTTITGAIPGSKHKELDMNPHNDWGGNYVYFAKGCQKNATLFLFDLSGSMSNNGGGSIPKIEQAKNASRQTLASMRNNGQGVKNEVAIYGFQGACQEDPTIEIFRFSPDLAGAEASITNMYPGGGTPLGKAIRAAECKLAAHVTSQGQQQGKLILLSDGQGTCGEIRPNGVYHNAPLQAKGYTIPAGQCGATAGQSVAVKYYTIGFDIPPGSPAERDLQYLSQLSGGKYLNVQNQTQLVRAFRKFNRVYQPKGNPALGGLPATSVSGFRSGVIEIIAEDFKKALAVNKTFVDNHPNDCHGRYNLALTQEANDYYQEAIKNYRQYLHLCPDPVDREFVEKQITFLEEEFQDFLLFQREVVRSDLDFLKLHFERIQNGQSVALAMEFSGFLQEKGSYYEELPRLIANKDNFLINITKDISEALDRCANLIRRKPETWDRDAVPIISMAYLNLKDLLEEM